MTDQRPTFDDRMPDDHAEMTAAELTDALCALHPDIQALRDIVLAHGGTGLRVAAPDPDITAMISRGRHAPGLRALVLPGVSRQAHRDAARRRADHGHQIATGYALHPDGLWREHSWTVDPDGRPVESAGARNAYFGFVLTDDEADEFTAGNP